MKKLVFWLGITLAIIGPLAMLAAWFYFNHEVPDPVVKSYVPSGAIVDMANVDFNHKVAFKDQPSDLITKAELQARPWRAVDGIYPTDPLTHVKLTDSIPLMIQPGQIMFSVPIVNTGLLTFIKPGDKVTILDTQSSQSVTDILVLAKYDKDANTINIMPSLREQDAQLTNGSAQANQNTPIQSSASLLLLGTQDQAMISAKISKPFVLLLSRTGLTSQHTDQGSGA